MLEFFPDIKDDELLYSAFSRFHVLDDDRLSHEKTTQKLVGIRSCHFTRDFPSRLKFFCDQLPGKVRVNPQILIEKHTLYPLFRPFVTAERDVKINEAMLGVPKGGQIAGWIGISGCRLPNLEFMKCCTDCIEDDSKKWGFPYWHRSHQVMGVFLCHIHKTKLMDTEIPFLQRITKLGYYPLDKSLISEPSFAVELDEKEMTQLQWISDQVHLLLKNKISSVGPIGIYERLHFYLRNQGFVTLNGKVRQNEVMSLFQGIYSVRILELLSCQLEKNSFGHTWVNIQLRGKKASTHPLFYLLLLQCFGIEPIEFLQCQPKKFLPFGEPPWPCLNNLSDHYKKLIIEDVKFSEDKKSGKLIGKFYCNCGFSYRRTGHDTCSEDRFRFDHVIRYGKVWNNEMLRLNNEGVTPVEFEKNKQVCRSTVHRRKKCIAKNPEKELTANWRNDKKTEKYREFIDLMHKSPDISRTQLRDSRGLISWLERNDKEWLLPNMPPRIIPKGSTRSRIDWVKRDEELSENIKYAVSQIMKMIPPERVSKQLIYDIMKVKKYQTHLDKLSNFNTKLKNLVESREDFQVRRTRIVAERLKSEGRLMRSTLIIEASLSKIANQPHIKKEIERLTQGEIISEIND